MSSDEKNEGIHFHGKVNAENMAVGSNASAIQNNYDGSMASSQQILNDLIAKLDAALKQVPSTYEEDAQVVTELAQELKEKTMGPKPNQKILEIKGDNLKKAAQNLAAIMPTVLAISTQIVAHIANLPK